jgi:hypothetical protein
MANLTQITGKIRLQLGKERSFRGHLAITRSWRRGTRPMDGRWRRKHPSSGVEGRKEGEAVPNRGRATAEYRNKWVITHRLRAARTLTQVKIFYPLIYLYPRTSKSSFPYPYPCR